MVRSAPSAISTSCATAPWRGWKFSAGEESGTPQGEGPDVDCPMRALTKTAAGVGHLEVLEMPTPSPGPGEALVRIGQSGLCGTDLLLYDGVYRGRNRPVPVPLVVGHEGSGVVVEVGP